MDGWMRLGMNGLSLQKRGFVIVLYRVLHSSIERSWCIVSGLSVLGMRQMRVKLRFSEIFIDQKMSLT